MTMIELAERLTELAERCEKAAGPDLDLDHAIGQAIGANGNYSYRPYTASLDAAMTLVPEGMQGQVQFGNRPGAWVGTEGGDAPDFNVAATPALALCAASLRSRAAQPFGEEW